MIIDFWDMLGEVGTIASFLTVSVTLLGAAALFLSNLARYMQAKKYGIPIKAVSQATMGDSAHIWILLVRILGLGAFVPLILLTVVWPWWIVLPVAAVSFFLGQPSSVLGRWRVVKRKAFKGRMYEIVSDITYRYIAVSSVICAIAYLRMHQAYHVIYASGWDNFAENILGRLTFYLAAFAIGLYALQLASKFAVGIYTTLFGGTECMVVDIDGQKYLVAMRNSHYHWILIPCEPEVVLLKTFKSGSTRTRSCIRFTKGIFIIRDMSTLESPVKRMDGYTSIDIGVPVEEERPTPPSP